MARLNYSKIKTHGKAYGTGQIAGTTTTWTLKGKYWMTPVADLPTHYLTWITGNRRADTHTQKAHTELQRRYFRQNNGVKERPVRDSNK